MNDEPRIPKYDRRRAGLKNDSTLWAKPTTIQNIDSITGLAETFVITTAQYDHPRDGGDYVFVECMDDTGLTRILLPPRVAAAVARQSNALRDRRARDNRRKAMEARKAAGWKPDFTKKKKPADSSAGMA